MSGVDTQLTPAAWWEASAEGRIELLRCPQCHGTWLPWMPHCPDCGPGTGPEAIVSTGRGTIYTWVVIHYSVSVPDEVPFTVAAVQLEEGAMIYGRLTPEAAADVRAGAEVEAVFVQRDGRTVADFAFAKPGD